MEAFAQGRIELLEHVLGQVLHPPGRAIFVAFEEDGSPAGGSTEQANRIVLLGFSGGT
ncbi:hypothetical protein ACWGJX_37130 [Streptomyces sp. NPDC054775]